jgi:hypothetical protein
VCAGLTSNHWHKEFIPGNTSLKMTPDDEMSVEKCIGVLLGSKRLELVRYLTSAQRCEAFNRTLERCNPKKHDRQVMLFLDLLCLCNNVPVFNNIPQHAVHTFFAES